MEIAGCIIGILSFLWLIVSGILWILSVHYPKININFGRHILIAAGLFVTALLIFDLSK